MQCIKCFTDNKSNDSTHFGTFIVIFQQLYLEKLTSFFVDLENTAHIKIPQVCINEFEDKSVTNNNSVYFNKSYKEVLIAKWM